MRLQALLVTASFLMTFASTSFAQQEAPAAAPRSSGKSMSANPRFRLLANYDYMLTSPGDLNQYRREVQWNGTTFSDGTFSTMNGFSFGAGYLLGSGYLGVEFNHATEDLATTSILSTPTSVQDTFEYEALYVTYDRVFNNAFGYKNQSYELGGGIGTATKFNYHNIFTAGSAQEDISWEAKPVVFKLRGNYNYHFSDNVRLRGGATYEYATSSSLEASSNHLATTIFGTQVVAGRKLRHGNGSDVKVDMSGFRFNVGIVVAF